MGRRSGPIKTGPLPAYVSEFFDRHGNARVRFRRKGYQSRYIKAPFPSEAFWLEYNACTSGEAVIKPGKDRSAPGSIDALLARYYANPARLGPSSATQKKNRAILGEFQAAHGHRKVNDCTFEPLDKIIEDKAKVAPWQATKLRRQLRKLFAFAKKLKMIDENPIDDTEPVRAQARTKSKGYHAWTEAEIAQFIARHPLGTKAHLAIMLFLWTFQRRGDVSDIGPSAVDDGWIYVEQEKSGEQTKLWIPMASPLKAAIDAFTPPTKWDGETYLCTEYGKRFSKAGLGNRMRKWCDEAGLPKCSAHGLRKSASRRAAEAGLSNQVIKSVTGHVEDDEVALYTRSAEQRAMAGDAIRRLEAVAEKLAIAANTAKKH